MRISTNVLYETGSSRIGELQSALVKVQEQISTGRRMLTPADDPVAAAQALNVTQAQAANEQLATNRRNANDLLSLEESVLTSVTSRLQDVKTLIIQAGNAALDDTQRKYIATELSGIFDDMMGMANSTDGTGNYLFSGFQSAVQPFSKTATGAQYAGDQGQRMIQVGASRQLASSDSGSAVFEANRTGNGTFMTGAAASNAGSGVASPGSVVNPAALTGNNYSLTFTVAAGVTTYNVVNTTTSTTLSTGNAYVAGQAITFDGMQFDIGGAPANGDQFTVQPSTNQSVFTTMTNLIAVLNAPASDAAAKAALNNGLRVANGNITNALDNVLTVRASVGIRLKEIESLDAYGEDRNIQLSKDLEQLQGLDYIKALTDLTKQKTMLEAAQQSFVKTSSLSLFNFI